MGKQIKMETENLYEIRTLRLNKLKRHFIKTYQNIYYCQEEDINENYLSAFLDEIKKEILA